MSACELATVSDMSNGYAPSVSRRALVAVTLALTGILFFQAWAVLQLRAAAYPAGYAELLPRFIGLPLLFAAVCLIATSDRQQPMRLFAARVSVRPVLAAIAIGLLARTAEWAQITARGAFGLLEKSRLADAHSFFARWDCPEAALIVTSAIVWLLLVPVTEEFVHRGIVQNAFRHRGRFFAIAAATIIFVLFHPLEAYGTVFVMGVILGVLYWNTQVLWYPIIAHAAYDGMNPIDKLCLKVGWNPAVESLPVLPTGLVATSLVAATLLAIVWLLGTMQRVEPDTTQPARTANPP